MRRRRRRRPLVVAVVLLVIVFAVLTFALFIRPATNLPRRAGAVVVLGDAGSQQLDKGIALVRAGYAPNLVVSTPTRYNCPGPIASVTVTCFAPNPATTQGEARFASALARRNHWSRIIVIPSTPQVSRARVRFGRCFSGAVLMDPADPAGFGVWAYDLVYEWGAMVKAFTLQRGC